MSLYEASGEELKAFWEKHAQMKQELGTQVSVENIQFGFETHYCYFKFFL